VTTPPLRKETYMAAWPTVESASAVDRQPLSAALKLSEALAVFIGN